MRWFKIAVVVFFVGQLLIKIVHVVLLVFTAHRWRSLLRDVNLLQAIQSGETDPSLVDAAQLVFSFITAVFVALGAFYMRTSHWRAFRWFQRSVLVSILLSQPFLFYREDWSALPTLAFNLSVFIVLEFMIQREEAEATAQESK